MTHSPVDSLPVAPGAASATSATRTTAHDWPSQDEAHTLAQRVLSFAKADQTRVTITGVKTAAIRFTRTSRVTSSESFDGAGVVVVSTLGDRRAEAATSRTDDDGLREVVARAEALARDGTPNAVYHTPLPGPQHYSATPTWSDATAAVISPDAFIGQAQAAIEAIRVAHLQGNGEIVVQAGATAILNSAGLFAYAVRSQARCSILARTTDGQASGWAGAVHTDWAHVQPKAIADLAIRVARQSVKAVAIEPDEYSVILEPAAFGALMLPLHAALRNGTFAARAKSATEAVCDPRISIDAEPSLADGPTLPFDDDGLPLTRTAWIEKGHLTGVTRDVNALHVSGGPPTKGAATVEQIVANTPLGVWVRRFGSFGWAADDGLDMTGVTRDGVFLVRDGKIERPVKNLRFRMNALKILSSLDMIGAPVRAPLFDLPVVVPPVRVRDFLFTRSADAG